MARSLARAFYLTPASPLKTSNATGMIASGKSYSKVWCAVILSDLVYRNKALTDIVRMDT